MRKSPLTHEAQVRVLEGIELAVNKRDFEAAEGDEHELWERTLKRIAVRSSEPEIRKLARTALRTLTMGIRYGDKW